MKARRTGRRSRRRRRRRSAAHHSVRTRKSRQRKHRQTGRQSTLGTLFSHPVQNRDELLRLLLTENLNHARHVEMERVTFLALSTALIIGALSVIVELQSNFVKLLCVAVLYVFNDLCNRLMTRWGEVFYSHMLTARRLFLLLIGEDENKLYDISPGADPISFWQEGFIRKHRLIDLYFVFDNKIHRERRRKSPLLSVQSYVRTRRVFEWYNHLINLCLIAIAMLYSAKFILCDNILPRPTRIALVWAVLVMMLVWRQCCPAPATENYDA